jgi:hypothetical protein
MAMGMNHSLLGEAGLTPGPNGELLIGNLGSSGNDGVLIPLHDADGWRGRLQSPDPTTPGAQIAWKLRGTVKGVPSQMITSGRMEATGSELHFFADSSLIGATAHLVEVFRDGMLIESAVVPSTEEAWTMARDQAPLNFVLQDFLGDGRWHQVSSFSEPQRIILGAGSGLPIEDADMVRISPVLTAQLPSNAPPYSLELTAMNLPMFQIQDEALLYRPIVAKEGLPHRALGLARMEAHGNRFQLSNLGHPKDGVSIEVGEMDSGIGILTESISIQPEGTELTLTAMGRLVSGRLSSLGTAGLVSDGRQIAVQASFDAVGSPNALAEVFDGNTLAGIVPLTAGQSVMLGPAPSGNVPDIGAVGVVPPCLRPGFEAIVQAGLQPVPCFYFEFTGQATFTLPDGTQAVGDRIRFLTQNGIGRFGSLSSFDINAALLGSGELTIQREKLRYPAPEITGLSRQRVGAGEVVEIIGRGFGDDPNGLSAIFGSNCLGLTPGKILSASDTRLTVEIGPLLAGAAGGLPEISRGVGVKSRPRLTVAGVELLEEALVFTHGGPAGRGTQLLQAAPPGPGSGTWYFSGPPSNGVLCLTFTNNWPSNALVRIIARLVDQTTGGGSYDIGIPAAQFTGGGTLLDCAQGIADLLRAALEQQAGVTPNISLAQSAAGVKLTLALPAGNRIDCGFLAIHVHAPPSRPTIIDVQPRNGREGDLIEIFGSGFGFDPDDLCITVQDSVSARLIPLRALMAGDTYIKARLGFVPPDARAGPLVVKRGEGRVGSFRPADSNTVVRATAWVWHGREPAIAGPPFEPLPRTPPVGTTSFDSEPPSNGVVCVTLLGNWPDNALVNVTVRAHDSMGGPGSLALDAPATQLPGGGTTLECAQRIADIIRSAFAQQAGRDVGVRVDPVAGAPAVKLTIFLPNGGHIDRGFVRIAVFPPAPAPMITDAQPRSGRAGDRVIITGRDFGEHLENLLVYVQGGNGVLTLLPVLTASPTQIVAQVGIVRPGAAAGQIIVRQGIGTRSFPQAAGITTHSASVDWQPTGTFGTGPSFNPVLTDPATCFHSVPPGDTNCPAGNVCLFLFDLNWPTSARVTIQYLFSSVPISPDPSQFPGNQKYAKLEIELPGGPGSLLACAGAICEFLRTQNLNCDLSASPDPIVIRLALTGMTVFGADPIYGFMSVCYQPAVFSGGVAHTALGFAALNQNAAGQLQVSNLGVEGEDGVGILLDQSEGMIWSMTLPSNRLTGALHFQTEGVTQGQKIIYSRIKLLLDESDISLTPDYRTAGALSYGLKLLSHGTVVHQRTSMMGMAALVHDAGLEFKFAHVEGPWNGGGWTPDEASPGTEAKPVELWLFPNEKLVELPDGQTFMADAVMTTPEAPQVQPEHISRHTILGEGLPGFTLQDTWLQMFGQPHQALGQATLVAQNGHLAVTDLGLSGSDGLAADFDALGEALGRTAVKGYQVSLSPLIIGNGAEFRIGARGLFNGTTRTYLGHAGLRKPGANAEVFADFSPIGATQIQVEIYRAGRRVGGAPAPGGGTVATLISSGAGLPNLNGAGKLPPLPFCFTLTFDGLATFVLPSGMRWLGDEIRLLASDATGVTEGLSTFEITAAGFDQITLLNATVLEEIRLRVEHVADRLRLAWPLSLSGYVLDETTNLSGRPIPWLPVPASVYQTNSPDIFVTLPLPSDNRFYRLRGP